MKQLVVILGCSLAGLGAGCSTHEEKFEKDAPARPADTAALTSASSKLVTAPQRDIATLPPEALVALTQATATLFDATGAPGMRDLARRYAGYLLRAQLPTGEGGVGFYSAARPQAIDPDLSIRAGLALIDAYEATQEPSLRDVIDRLTGTVTSAPFGWVPFRGGAGLVDTNAGGRRVIVARTALASALLSRAASAMHTSTRQEAAQAFRTVDGGQAAVGRWYAYLPSRSPMNLRTWATTLGALERMTGRAAEGILGGGVPGLYTAAFTSNGRLKNNALTKGDATGIALSYGVLARYADAKYASAAFRELLSEFRQDGTARYAPADDFESQALFADAMAAEAARLRGQ